MNLINEKDHLTITIHNLLDHTLQTFFKLSLILSARNKGTQVEGVYLSAFEVFRNISVHYLLRDALRNRSFSNSRLSDQDRIILGSPA